MSNRGLFHGSGEPADWRENNDKAPWWKHADNWHDIRDAVAAGLPVFIANTGERINDMIDLGIHPEVTDARQVLIPQSFYEQMEQQAIESILQPRSHHG